MDDHKPTLLTRAWGHVIERRIERMEGDLYREADGLIPIIRGLRASQQAQSRQLTLVLWTATVGTATIIAMAATVLSSAMQLHL